MTSMTLKYHFKTIIIIFSLSHFPLGNTAMAAIETALSIFCPYPSTTRKFQFHLKSLQPTRFHNSTSTPKLSFKFSLYPLPLVSTKKSSFEVHSTAETVAIQEKEQEKAEKTQQSNTKRKLFVLNLPWSYTVADIKNHFSDCGAVTDVEIIKQKDGKNRGFAFVTMATGEGAQAAIDKFDSSELSGRIIRVEYAKRFKKPTPSSPPVPPPRETRHKLYVSNLAWKVRSTNLREFFSANFNPVSARVVFDSPSGKSAGYGFVSFATKEEAEAAISALDGKELLGRPIRLKFSERNVGEESESTPEETTEEQHEES